MPWYEAKAQSGIATPTTYQVAQLPQSPISTPSYTPDDASLVQVRTNVDPATVPFAGMTRRIGASASEDLIGGLRWTATGHAIGSYDQPIEVDYDWTGSVTGAPSGSYGWLVCTARLNTDGTINSSDKWPSRFTIIQEWEYETGLWDTFAPEHRTIADGGATEGEPVPLCHMAARLHPIVAGWGMATDYGSDEYVTYIEVTNGGSGYTSPPTVTISADPYGDAPDATARIQGGSVVAVDLDGIVGLDYASAPSVTFSGGGGSGAAATARLISESIGPVNSDPSHEVLLDSDGTPYLGQMPQPWGADYVCDGDETTYQSGDAYGWVPFHAFIYGEPRTTGRLFRDLASAAELQWYAVVPGRHDGNETGTYPTPLGSPLATTAITAGTGEVAITLPANATIPVGTWVVPILRVDPTDHEDIWIDETLDVPSIWCPFEPPPPPYVIPAGRDVVVMPE